MKYLIQRYKTTVMQRLMNSVAREYHYHTSGTCPPEKVKNMIDKFERLYEPNLTESQRYRRKKKGIATCKLLVYPHIYHEDDKPVFLWWIVATKGTGLIHENEKMLDARNPATKLKYEQDYELVRVTKEVYKKGKKNNPDQSKLDLKVKEKKTPNEDNQKLSWTWQLSRKRKEIWRKRIKQAINQKNNIKMQKVLMSMGRMPGFHGIRNSTFELANYYRKTFDNKMKNSANKKENWEDRAKGKNKLLPLRIGYTRTNPDCWIDISIVIKRMQKGLKPIPRERK